MELVSSGILTTFEVTFIDPGLFVQAALYDMTSGSPVGPTLINMTELTAGTYYATFTPLAGKIYLLVKRVYTDGTYAVLDTNYPPSSETAQSVDFGSASAASILNAILSNFTIVGSVGAALTAAGYRNACLIEGKIINSTIEAEISQSNLSAEISDPKIVAEIIEENVIQC